MFSVLSAVPCCWEIAIGAVWWDSHHKSHIIPLKSHPCTCEEFRLVYCRLNLVGLFASTEFRKGGKHFVSDKPITCTTAPPNICCREPSKINKPWTTDAVLHSLPVLLPLTAQPASQPPRKTILLSCARNDMQHLLGKLYLGLRMSGQQGLECKFRNTFSFV